MEPIELFKEATGRSTIVRRVWTVLAFLVISALLGAWFVVSPTNRRAHVERLVVTNGMDEMTVVRNLREGGFIRSTRVFWAILTLNGWHGTIKPGGYRIAKSMSAFEIARSFAGDPYMQWVVIPEGLRKEEIAEILEKTLAWDEVERQTFLNPPASVAFPLSEGYYFPDTYLIERNEDGAKVANRMLARFNEKFRTYYDEFIKQNVKHTTAIKLASLVEREAAGPSDMPLVAGIFWHRLAIGMKLDIDATLQYMRGKVGQNWWTKVNPADKKLDSPYNTYKYAGLPPTPISNPGLAAIEAVLHPMETRCLYYVHDRTRQIRCAETYAEHLKNIERYLRN